MPHDAATYIPSAAGTKTPRQTYDRVQDEVFDARVEYRQTATGSYSQCRYLTTGAAPSGVPDIGSYSPATKVMDPAQALFSLVITGTGFTALSKVWWNNVEYTPSAWTATTLTVSVPAAPYAWAYSVYVMNDGGIPSNVKKYTFTETLTRRAETIDVIKQSKK
jgi:IPT/TIG domain